MKRFITKELLAWKEKNNRKPLIVRGARQIGKSYTINEFGKTYFKGVVHLVDFEQRPDWCRVFETNLDIKRIITEFEILLNTRINAEKDLLFFDEIQACPRAIMSLRYFYEQMPQLHIIAAGSLLEFAMKDISFPVGRVQMINMFPMGFAEYLIAQGKNKAAEIIQLPPTKQSDTVHNMLLEELKHYFFIGGMPECVQTWNETNSLPEVFNIQENLLNSYREDFGKYAPYSDKRCLNATMSGISKRIGQQIKYSRLAEGFSNPTIKKAFDLLDMARVVRKIQSTSPSGLPLSANASERKFKALMLDIGLMRAISGLQVDVEYVKADLLSIYSGAMAEQFVGQEFLAAGNNALYYWSREARNSNAEVDFLIVKDNSIYPVEIKYGPSGRLRSLHLLLQNYPKSMVGYVLSSANYSELKEQKLIFIPLYYAFSLIKN
jgi:predicted AAA+ superfamily ATPase